MAHRDVAENSPPASTISRFFNWKEKRINEELKTLLYNEKRTVDDITEKNRKLKQQSENDRKALAEKETRITLLQNEMLTLESKISSLEDEKDCILNREEALKKRVKHLEVEVDKKERDSVTCSQESIAVDMRLREKIEQTAQTEKKLNDANAKMSQMTEENKQLQAELQKLRAQADRDYDQFCCKEKEMTTQVQKLQTDLDAKRREISTLSSNMKKAQLETQTWKENSEKLQTDLEDRESNETRSKQKITHLEKEKELLKKQVEDRSNHLQNYAEENRIKMKEQMADLESQIRHKEETVRRCEEKIKNLAEENVTVKKENDSLKQQKSVLEAQHASNEKYVAVFKTKMAALQASSDTREEMMQKDIDRLTQQRIADLQKQEEKHASEKEELQLQIQKFLQILNDEKSVERETIRSTIEQMVHTHSITTGILQTAFRTVQRRQYPAARIREMDDV